MDHDHDDQGRRIKPGVACFWQSRDQKDPGGLGEFSRSLPEMIPLGGRGVGSRGFQPDRISTKRDPDLGGLTRLFEELPGCHLRPVPAISEAGCTGSS